MSVRRLSFLGPIVIGMLFATEANDKRKKGNNKG